MQFVLTLIANPADPAVDPALAAAAAAAVGSPDAPRWLAPGIAADAFFEADLAAIAGLEAAARAIVDGRPVDVAIRPAAGRRKHLLVADMDSTIIGQECIDELADYAGLKAEVAAITEAAMRGELAFEAALRLRIALLAGLPVSVIHEVIAQRLTLTPGARTLVQTMRAHGARTLLVSGGFTVFTAAVTAMVGFEEHRGNTLIIEDDHIAGTAAEPILGREAKLQALLAGREALGLDPSDTLAVGDGANDLAMIGAAGLGVAYRAKPIVATAAPVRIDHGDLTALLYLQGYSRDEFRS